MVARTEVFEVTSDATAEYNKPDSNNRNCPALVETTFVMDF